MHRHHLPRTLLLSLALVAGAAGAARADGHHADWMPTDQVIRTLTAAGYSSVSAIEPGDDRWWEGRGVKDGRTWEFHADPHSGAILREKPED